MRAITENGENRERERERIKERGGGREKHVPRLDISARLFSTANECRAADDLHV